ncbi:ketimine reductase mu-crystallin [Palaemon carinicauda]|uniref:ketimine reductase mu-crystallin n=1 Tax=Palaemon carinicauda TaxID=392227 RepID=UPI0035B68096
MSSGDLPPAPHSSGSIRWIRDDDVRRLLTWDDLIEEVRKSLVAFSRGPDHPEGVVQPLRSRVPIADEGLMLVMPGLAKEQGALATKIVTVFGGNASKGLSTHHALILLMDSSTGVPVAILDGEVITEMRTAAASAVATLELVEKKSNLIVAVLGAGTQGRSHARVMSYLFKGCKIRIWSRTKQSSQTLAATLASEGIVMEVVTSVEEAVKDADIINTCTMASKPILKAEWVKPGAHINSVGAPSPDKQELEEELVRKAMIYADSKDAAFKESGDVIKAGASVFAEIGEVILQTRVARKDSTTIFKSLGLAVEDAVTAHLVYNLLMKENEKRIP